MAHRKSFARLPGQRESVHKTQPDSRRPLFIASPLECLDCLPVIRHGFDPLFIRIQSVGHHAPRLDQMAIVLRLCRKRQGLARNRKALPGRTATRLAAREVRLTNLAPHLIEELFQCHKPFQLPYTRRLQLLLFSAFRGLPINSGQLPDFAKVR